MLRGHPRISLYLRREEYEMLKSLAESKGISIKEFIMSLIQGFEKYYEDVRDEWFDKGFREAMALFLEYPQTFYSILVDEFPNAKEMEVALFTVPCSICGKPMVFTHRDLDWAKEVRPTLHQAFRNWYHVCCKEVMEGKRKSCTHLPRGLG